MSGSIGVTGASCPSWTDSRVPRQTWNVATLERHVTASKGSWRRYPHNREIRLLLAEAYRRDRQSPEAGRWGYLMGPAASERERRAFEKHSAFGGSPRITEGRLRRLLRVSDLASVADETGRAILRDLPSKHSAHRTEGLWSALGRFFAAQRSRLVWR
jgi:hypothetical protein